MACAVQVAAQDAPADTVQTQQLNAVVVEAQMQSASPTELTYIPTSRQKNASQTGMDLLRQMAIPQLQINPVDNSVKSNAGEDVSLFINYMPASQEELDGMRTADVRKVEYLEFPTDPRFRGAKWVVNFIVQEYAYGGYTKVTADEDFLIGLSSRVNVFSKFTFKKLTYDLYVASNNYNDHHTANSAEARYSLLDATGTPYTLTRTEFADNVHFRNNQFPITLRATYNTEKLQIRNTVGYSRSSYPVNTQSGALIYSPNVAAGYTYSRTSPSHSNSLSYNGSYYIVLPNDFAIDASPLFSYTHTNDALTYSSTASDPIERNARENAYNYRLDAYLHKRINQQHTLMLGGVGGEWANNLRYTGSSLTYDRFKNYFLGGMLCYQLRLDNVRLYSDAGFLWEKSDINGIQNADRYPFVHINLSYSPNSHHSAGAYFQFANNTPGIDSKASDLLQDNEYMYLTGYPLLENSRHITINLSYAWMPSNKLSMSAYGNYFELFDRQMTVYEPYNDGSALLRTFINSGNYIQGEIGVSANVKLFDSKLHVYFSPRHRFYRSTGVYERSFNPFQFQAQATYYLDQFHFTAYYMTPNKMMFSSSPRTYRSRDNYGIEAGWGNSEWNVTISASNLFNSKWDVSDHYIESPLYTEHRTGYGTSYHAQLNLSVTYTFGYGKKVQRGNEVGAQQGAGSGILK